MKTLLIIISKIMLLYNIFSILKSAFNYTLLKIINQLLFYIKVNIRNYINEMLF